MPQAQDDKRVLNFVPVEEETHSILVELANQQGIKVNEFLGLLADEWSLVWEPPQKKRSARALFWNWVEMRRKKRLRDMIYQMVSLYQQLDESEELADLIEQQCEIAGISPSDLQAMHQDVARDPLSSIIAQSREGTKFSQCMGWLASTFRQIGPEIAVRDLQQLAMVEGFAWAMVNKAKAYIRDDRESTVEILSEKRGAHWAWVMIDKATQEPIKREEHVHV